MAGHVNISGPDDVIAATPATAAEEFMAIGQSLFAQGEAFVMSLRFWIEDPTGGLTNIRGNVYLALWDAFQANGISIPFPQREVKVLSGPDDMPAAQGL